MTNTSQLFLIVMTKLVIKELGDEVGNLEDELRTTTPIRLYKLFYKKTKKEALVLSLPSGRALILRKDEEENYFVCTRYSNFPPPPASLNYRLELSDKVEGRLIKSGNKVHPYLINAVNCSGIEQEIQNKEAWDPWGGNDTQSKFLHAYIDLHKVVLEKQRFGLDASGYTKTEKIVRVNVSPEMFDDDSAENIKKASGERIAFSFLPPGSVVSDTKRGGILGKLRSFNAKEFRMDIDLDRDFKGFEEAVKQGHFYTASPIKPSSNSNESGNTMGAFPLHNHTKTLSNDKDIISDKNPESGDKISSSDEVAQIIWEAEEPHTAVSPKTFFYDKDRKIPAFSCSAVCITTGKWLIEPSSIKPQNMMLFADFNGDLHQLAVMKQGLKRIASQDIWQVLSEERVSKLPDSEIDITWGDNCRLNSDQKEAVKKAVGAQELCLIWGPPGTGKTEVIMEIAKQECLRGHKTLIASQANLAVDNALARLHHSDQAWPFRIAKEGYALEHEDQGTVPMKDTAGDFMANWITEQLKNNESDGDLSKIKQHLIKGIKSKDQPERAKAQLAALYRRRINVVGATLMETGKTIKAQDGDVNSAHDASFMKGKKDPRKNRILSEVGISKFDTVIVDEVSKALPTELYLPILTGKKVVLVGDHKQLPPMWKVNSGDSITLEELAEEANVPEEAIDTETTLFEKLWKKHDGNASGVRQMLTKQYRMHHEIQQLIEPFYADDEGSLECGLGEDDLRRMRISLDDTWGRGHAFWMDTNVDADESRDDGTSYYNPQEIEMVGEILKHLPNKDLDGKDLSVGVITFYGAQLRRLRDKYEREYSHKFADGRLIFGTVDRFQGRENDVVICSLVRKNNQRTIGFATKPNRINVAFSRARRVLCIVGNSGTFCYEGSNKKALELYRGIYGKCHKLTKRDIVE